MSNIFPQQDKMNDPVWKGLEEFARKLVEAKDRELYIYAGTNGEREDQPSIVVDISDPTKNIRVPDEAWKVVTILDKPGIGLSEIDSINTKAFAVLATNKQPPLNLTPPPTYYRWNDPQNDPRNNPGGVIQIMTVKELEEHLNSNPINRLHGVQYNFFSHLSKEIRDSIKDPINPIPIPPGVNPHLDPVFLLAAESEQSIVRSGFASNTTIWHDSILINNVIEDGLIEDGSSKVDDLQSRSAKVGTSQISILEAAPMQTSISEVGFSQDSFIKTYLKKIDSLKPGSAEISKVETYLISTPPTEIDFAQTASADVDQHWNILSEISFASGIQSEQIFVFKDFLFGHSDSPYNLIWNSVAPRGSSIGWNETDVDIRVANLPKGRLAETYITRLDHDGHPVAGTLLIDDDANGTGWFIDPTPWESSEFSLHNTEYNFQAAPDSIAYGRYDLLTTIFHELGHLAGFIAGHDGFDDHVHNHTFTDGDLTAPLTADGSHLTDPLRLMSPYLTPGMRKLPSELELRILQAIRNHDGTTHTHGTIHGTITAAQTAAPLVGITNGDFEQLLDQWNHRGTVQATQFTTSTAVTLTEDSPILSQLSQTFVIPQDASQRYLTFDLLETTLGSTTHRPPDAFEVALLDATTLKPLVGTAIGLTNTDALLNLQSNGTLYLDDDVTVTDLGNGHRRVRIDLGDLATGLTNIPTTATLYFDLLGFGAADSRITIDNITFGKGSTPPVATDDTATLTQGQSTPLNLLTNDTADQPLTPSQLTLATNPTHGSLSRDEQGNLIYNPFDGYAGSDSFTYRLTNSDGEASNLATVNLEILNAAPQIQTIALPNTATEGTPLSFTAAATDPGNDALTYTWTFSDGSPPAHWPNHHTYLRGQRQLHRHPHRQRPLRRHRQPNPNPQRR